MSRATRLLIVLLIALGAFDASAQTKKAAAPARPPTDKDQSISVVAYMRDAAKNELLVETKIWPGNPEYTTVALQRYFALLSALGTTYRLDDGVAYTWQTKNKVTKCSIYLESWEASAKGATGSVVGCEANGVSNIAVTSSSDPKHGVSPSSDPKHQSDVLELFKKQLERAKANVPK